MKKMKKLISVLLTMTLILSVFVFPVTASAATVTQQTKVQYLYALGLFKGYDETGTNFGLNDGVTREQAIIFLIRMLGEEKAAAAWTGAQPFADLPSGNYYYPYIGYAKDKGYTNGLGNNKFGLGDSANMLQMTAFALRGLGYSEASGDFTYLNSLDFAKNKGILDSATAPATFNRGDAVDIIYGAISTNVKGQSNTLLQKLVSGGAITQAQLANATAILNGTAQGQSNIEAGTYTMSCMSNYIRISSNRMELRNTTPQQAFTITNKNGYCTIQTEDGLYVGLTALKDGTQLTTGTTAYSWVIQKQSGSTYTIRPADKTGMVVNASEQKSTNGTAMIIWTHSGAPQNTLITFTSTGNAVTGVKLDQTTTTVRVGSTVTLTCTVSPTTATNKNLTWTSSAPTIAKVDSNGKVTGVKEGTATITVKTVSGGKTATCTVTVSNTTVAVTGVKLDKITATVGVGSTVTLTGTVSPTTATNKNLTWTSSVPTVATVDSSGKVTGVKTGTATITAKTVDGGKIATCTITVTAATEDTTAASTALLKRYNSTVARFNATQESLKSVGLYDGSLKTDWENFSKQLNSNLGFIGGASNSVYTDNQISTANAILDEVDKMLNKMDQVIEEAKVTEDTSKESNALRIRMENVINRHNRIFSSVEDAGRYNGSLAKALDAIAYDVNEMQKRMGQIVSFPKTWIAEMNSQLDSLEARITAVEKEAAGS